MAVNIGSALLAATKSQQQLGMALNLGSYDAWAAKLAIVNSELRKLQLSALIKDLAAMGGWSQSMAQGLDAAKRKAVELSAALATGAYDVFASKMAAVSQQIRSMGLENLRRDLAARGGFSEGMIQSLDQASRKIIELRAAMSSGAYGDFANKMAAANQELKRLQQQAHLKDLTAQYGTFQGTLIYGAETIGQWANKVGKAFGDVRGALQALGAMSVSDVAGFVAKGAPATFERFTRASTDLAGAVGQVLVPVLLRVTDVIRGMADFVANMTPQTKELVTVIVGAGLAATTAAGLIIGGITAVSAAMTVLNVETAGIPILIGGIVTGVAALAGAFAMWSTTGNGFGAMWESIMAKMEPVATLASAVGTALMQMLAGAGDALADFWKWFGPTTNDLSSMMTAFLDLAGAINLSGDAWRLIGALMGAFVGGVLTPIIGGVYLLVKVLDLAAQGFTRFIAAGHAAMVLAKGGDFWGAYNSALLKFSDEGQKMGVFQSGKSWGAGGFTPWTVDDAFQVRQRFQDNALAASIGQQDPTQQTADNTRDIAAILRDIVGGIKEGVGAQQAAPKVIP